MPSLLPANISDFYHKCLFRINATVVGSKNAPGEDGEEAQPDAEEKADEAEAEAEVSGEAATAED